MVIFLAMCANEMVNRPFITILALFNGYFLFYHNTGLIPFTTILVHVVVGCQHNLEVTKHEVLQLAGQTGHNKVREQRQRRITPLCVHRPEMSSSFFWASRSFRLPWHKTQPIRSRPTRKKEKRNRVQISIAPLGVRVWLDIAADWCSFKMKMP